MRRSQHDWLITGTRGRCCDRSFETTCSPAAGVVSRFLGQRDRCACKQAAGCRGSGRSSACGDDSVQILRMTRRKGSSLRRSWQTVGLRIRSIQLPGSLVPLMRLCSSAPAALANGGSDCERGTSSATPAPLLLPCTRIPVCWWGRSAAPSTLLSC